MRIEKILIFILIIAILATFIFIFYLFFGKVVKIIKISFPIGGEELRVGDIYKITWESRGIKKVGIVLFKGQNPEWIAKDIDASLGEYEWKIYPGQEYGGDFWLAIVEFPWREGNKVAFTQGAFAIVYPELSSCDSISIEKQWPYVPGDLPNIRRVFITEESYSGDLGGIEGADIKCQQEAKKQGYTGTWRAFIGGDSAQELAVERLKKTPRKTKGIFVEARPGAKLPAGINCYPLLGKNFDEFLTNFSNLTIINERKFSANFFEEFGNIWLGRIDQQSKNNCITTEGFYSFSEYQERIGESYSYTSTCQRWSNGNPFVAGYPVPEGGAKPSFPTCYTPQGKRILAVGLAGLSTGIEKGSEKSSNRFTPYQGKSCQSRQKLLCIED